MEPSEGTANEAVLFVGEGDAKGAQKTLIQPATQALLEVTKPVETTQLLDQPQGTKSLLPTVDLSRKGQFTVQLVTYDNQKQATQEVVRLKAKGYDSFVIPSGHYFQVCVHYFENQAKAQNLLKQFRESGRYSDAYVRPVVR